ncbi:MAG: DUF3880 domain-containing protein [Bacillota bacterium]|nr:DUF3880 domain-containing protein [Bacillota bacterium]
MFILNKTRNYEKYAELVPKVTNRPTVKQDLIIAGILKDETFEELSFECDIIRLTDNNSLSIAEDKKISLLIVDTLDKVIDLADIIRLFGEKDIRCVYWDTDINNFTADYNPLKLFDFIFTVDKSRVDKFKEALGHNNVFFLPFAVQPRIFNPIENMIMNKEKDIVFPSDFQLSRVADSTCRIYDLLFKEKADVNSILKQVMEILAVGTVTIGQFSDLIDNFFPQIIKLYKTQGEKTNLLSSINNEKEAIEKLSVLGQRAVFNNHTTTNRLDTIMQKTGLHKMIPPLPGITVVTSTNRLNSMDNVFNNYECQNYRNLELIVILNNNKMDIEEWRNKAQNYDNVKIYQIDEKYPLGRCLNYAVDNSSFPYLTKFDDDNYYAPNFLSDLMLAYKYADAEIVGKLSYYCYLEGCHILGIMCPNMEYRYVNMLSGSALIIKKEVFEKVRFADKPTGCDTVFLKECIQNGIHMYSGDQFNYVYNRHALQENHTWKMSDEVFLKSCKVIDVTDDCKPRVTV